MTISVSQLNNYIHGMLELDGALSDISVCGEITNLKQSRDGWYFSLKDENSAIDCFCYGNVGATLQQGSVIVAEGKVNFWVKSGRISFFVRRFSSSQNTGAAYQKFVELRDKLQKEGLFDENRKKIVPKCCMKIGVVTSATGAVIHDIQNVVHRRQPFSDIVLYPVKVQGVDADIEIAQGVLYFSQTDVDAVIVGRGGGSNEDLSAFNSEVVVRAIAACEKPVVSAVGHGVDFTLCDFVADKRAVTPTEAAEFVTLDSEMLKKDIIFRLNRLQNSLRRRLENDKKSTLYSIKRISSQISSEINGNKTKITLYLKNGVSYLQSRLQKDISKTENAVSRLSAANPLNVLQRGYAYVERGGERVHSALQVNVGDCLDVKLHDGKLNVEVKNKL